MSIPYIQKNFRCGGDYWYSVNEGHGTTAATALTTGVQYFVPIRIDNAINILSVGMEATATASTAIARVGIYADAGTHYSRPGALLKEFGSLDVSAAGFPNSSGTSQAITAPGLYWFSVVNQTAAATVRTFSLEAPPVRLTHGTTEPAAVGTVVAYSQTGITGALADFAATTALTGALVAPWLYFQVD